MLRPPMKKHKPAAIEPRRYSRLVVDGLKQTPSRAMLRAVGFSDADFKLPQVGIASTWSNLTPCNMHIDGLARLAAAGVEAHGAKAVTFNTITVSDGIAMGTPGMRYSLVSREVIASTAQRFSFTAEPSDRVRTSGTSCRCSRRSAALPAARCRSSS